MLEIKAGLYHCLRILNHERHKYRPINSWCKSKKGLPCLDKLHRLNSVFEEPLEKIYDPLSEQAFLIRCMPGYTQNTNEFVKALAWNKCPMHKWHGRKWIVMATVSAASHFSCGTTTKKLMSWGKLKSHLASTFGRKQDDDGFFGQEFVRASGMNRTWFMNI